MANLTEAAQWEAGIYRIETSDPVVGGEDGINNKGIKQLANRTAWLKERVEESIIYKGVLEANNQLIPQTSPLLDEGRLILTDQDYGKLIRSNATGGARGVELPSASAGAEAPIGTFFDLVNYVDYSTGSGHHLNVWVKWSFNGASSDNIIDPVTGIAQKSFEISPGGSATVVKIAESLWMVVRQDQSDVPGEVIMRATPTTPHGFLKCNGALKLRANYPRLYAAIGDTYDDPGDPADVDEFRLPDFRGEFVRFFDDGRGEDDGRTFNSVQSEQIGGHIHHILTIDEDDQNDVGNSNEIGTIQGGGQAATNRDSGTNNISGVDENRPKNITLAAFIRY